MEKITVTTNIGAPLSKVWECYTNPLHVEEWNHASDDWECPYAENDLVEGGRFLYTMSAIDDSASFDFEGEFTEIIPEEKIAYRMDDGREAEVTFEDNGDDTVTVTTVFDPETENTPEVQQAGWQAILDNFKQHTETVELEA